MCVFSGDVDSVRDTSIFARIDGADQLLAYSMSLSTSSDVAMILPVPTLLALDEEALSFIDLSACPTLFDALDEYFLTSLAVSADVDGQTTLGSLPLPIHNVGAFEATEPVT